MTQEKLKKEIQKLKQRARAPKYTQGNDPLELARLNGMVDGAVEALDRVLEFLEEEKEEKRRRYDTWGDSL